jgi:hypothetical protein
MRAQHFHRLAHRGFELRIVPARTAFGSRSRSGGCAERAGRRKPPAARHTSTAASPNISRLIITACTQRKREAPAVEARQRLRAKGNGSA